MSNEKVAEVLEKAADLLESEEAMWIRGDFETLMNGDTGLMGHCAVGTLCRAANEKWNAKHPVTTEALEFIKPHIINHVYDLAKREATVPSVLPSKEDWDAESATIMFNDRIVEDKEGIIEVFKHAAKDVRNRA